MSRREAAAPTRDASFLAGVALVAGSILAAEVSLTRALAITHWHDLAPLVIGVALLGLGAAGTLAALAPVLLERHARSLRFVSATALAALLPLSTELVQHVPLRIQALVVDRAQVGWLAVTCALTLLPFFAGAAFLTAALVEGSERAGFVYGADLLGSAAGAVAALPLVGTLGPEAAVRACAGAAMVAAALQLERWPARLAMLAGSLALVGALHATGVPTLRMTDMKELPRRLLEPDARVVEQLDGALARLTVVQAPGLHSAPGWSLNATDDPPEQWALYFDGDQGTPLLREPATSPRMRALAGALAAAPHVARPRRSVLVLQPGGGWDAWVASASGAAIIELVEPNPAAARIVRPFLPPGARQHVAEPRRFVADTDRDFDAIVGRTFTTGVGTPAVRESYEWTVEAFAAMLEHLEPGGSIAVSAPLAPLPRDAVRLAATAAAALERRGASPREHVALLHDWGSSVLLVARDPLGDDEVRALRAFGERWSFDLAALPGLARHEANRFHARGGPELFDAMAALLAGREPRERFLERHAFDLRPTTDDRPFFHQFFRWRSVPHLRETMGPDWPRHAGWGYFLGVIALGVVTLLAAALVLAPLVVGRVGGLRSVGRLRTLTYFAAIGLGFMGIEMALLQKATLVIGTPLAAIGVVLAAMLLGAGTGSLLAARLSPDRRVTWLAAALVAALAPATLLSLGPLLGLTAGWSLTARASVVAVLLIALALPMGTFLPRGIARVRAAGAGAVAWAWAVNGFASVVAAVGSSVLAMHFGLLALVLVAAACYVVAACAAGQAVSPTGC